MVISPAMSASLALLFVGWSGYDLVEEAQAPATGWGNVVATVPDMAARTEVVDRLLSEAFANGLSPGMSVALVDHGKIVYAKGFGLANAAQKISATADTAFYIASTTKSLTGLAVMQGVKRGLLDLKAPITRYLPSLRYHRDKDSQSVTLESLLSHTHGIDPEGPISLKSAYTGEFQSSDDLLAQLDQHGPAKKGKDFAYSNLGPILAAYALEAASGKSWKKLIQEDIFAPLAMKNSANNRTALSPSNLAVGYELQSSGFAPTLLQKTDKTMHAAGGSFSSARDLAAWIGVHMARGQWQGTQIFAQDLLQASLTQRATQSRKSGPFILNGWALGWDIGSYQNEIVYSRPGAFSGYSSHISFFPERNVGLVVLANGGSTSGVLINHVVDLVYAEWLQKPRDEVERKSARDKILTQLKLGPAQAQVAIAKAAEQRASRQKPLPFPKANYTGTYRSSGGTMVWRLANEELWVDMGLVTGRAEVFDANKNALRVEILGVGEVVNFIEDGTAINQLKYAGRLFERVK